MREAGIRELLFRPREDGEERKTRYPFVIWLIIGSVLFLAISSFGGDGKEKKDENRTEETMEVNLNEYTEELERRLTNTLQKISGAGHVSVFINIEDNGERILASDRSRKSQEDGEDGTEARRTEEENHVILWEQDGEEMPYVIKERTPELTGVLVVAEGAGNEAVRQEIYEAVRAIFGLPAHRIKITN